MTPDMNCVTANFERGSESAWTWLEETLADGHVKLLFGQELAIRQRLVDLAGNYGYQIVGPALTLDPQWSVVSWVLAAKDLSPRPSADERLQRRLRIHESYVAAAEVDWPGCPNLTVVSMHASPATVPSSALSDFEKSAVLPRHGGGGRDSGSLFYSDLLLDAIGETGSRGCVLAAGDLNETRDWDAGHPPSTWGAEFFSRVDEVGLRDVTYGLWGSERRTRWHPTHPAYQLDHVLASPQIADRIAHAEVDPRWTEDSLGSRADHAPVWFRLDPSLSDALVRNRP